MKNLALRGQTEQRNEAYEVACKIVDSWPSWKREIVNQNAKISQEFRTHNHDSKNND